MARISSSPSTYRRCFFRPTPSLRFCVPDVYRGDAIGHHGYRSGSEPNL